MVSGGIFDYETKKERLTEVELELGEPFGTTRRAQPRERAILT